MHKSLAICAALCALLVCGSSLASAHSNPHGDGKPWQVVQGMARHGREAGQPLKAMPRALLDHTDYNSYSSVNLQSKYISWAKWAVQRIARHSDILSEVLCEYYQECYKVYYSALKQVYSYQEWNAETCQYDTYYRLVITIKYGEGYSWSYYDIDAFVYVPCGYTAPEYLYRVAYQGHDLDGQWY